MVASSTASLAQGAPAKQLPARLSDVEFWAFVSSASEPSGYFSQDNWTSNEMDSPMIAALLASNGVSGGAYMGVGPEQNFTYIAAVRPSIAFIVDIRRQAVLQHLMYKAIFEMAPERADFIALLFSRPRPRGVDTAMTIGAMWDRFRDVGSDRRAYERNREQIMERLTRTHGFDLSSGDRGTIEMIYSQFFNNGPLIGYLGGAAYGRGSFAAVGPGGIRSAIVDRYAGVNYMSLTASVDNAGVPRSFLSSEARYRVVRDLQMRNLVIPVVGDFAGPKAIRAVGRYLHEHGTPVSAFYLSNVEDYLFRDPGNALPNNKYMRFYPNAGTLPVTESSIFIRYRVADGSTLCPIAPFLRAFNDGRVTTPQQVSSCAR